MDLTGLPTNRISGRQSKNGGGHSMSGSSVSGYIRALQGINGYGGHSTIRTNQLWTSAMSGAMADAERNRDVDEACPQLTLQTIRKIRRHPTIALGRGLMIGPIYLSGWQYKSKPGTDSRIVDAVKSVYEPLREHFVGQMAYAVDYGHRGFEQVWERRREDGLMALRRLIPLRPDINKIRVDDDTGDFAGFNNNGRIIDVPRSLLVTPEVEDDNLQGTTRYENLAECAWWPWIQALRNVARLDEKISGIIPLWYYDSTPDTDEEGNEVDPLNDVIQGIKMLRAGIGVAIANEVDQAQTAREVGEYAKMARSFVDFYDAGNQAPAASAMLERMRYFDSLMFRGLLLPERMATEGQYGTKAESEVQGQLGLVSPERLIRDALQALNWHSVDRFLALNWGEGARGTVWIEASPLQDAVRDFYRGLYQTMLQSPSVGDYVAAATDWDKVMELAGIPRSPLPSNTPLPGQQPTLAAPIDPATGQPVDPAAAVYASAGMPSTVQLDCGTGDGGFKPGNTCGGEGGGGGAGTGPKGGKGVSVGSVKTDATVAEKSKGRTDKAFEQVAVERGKTVDEVEAVVTTNIKTSMVKSGVFHRMSSDNLKRAFESGRFKNALSDAGTAEGQVFRSEGEVEERAKTAKVLFGASPSVFGYASENADGFGNKKLDEYGDVSVKFKPSVHDRTTITGQDSNAYEDDEGVGARPSPFKDPSPESFSPKEIKRMAKRGATVDKVSQYVEAQIHGPVTIDDIESVTFMRGAVHNEDLRAKLKAKGIKVKVILK